MRQTSLSQRKGSESAYSMHTQEGAARLVLCPLSFYSSISPDLGLLDTISSMMQTTQPRSCSTRSTPSNPLTKEVSHITSINTILSQVTLRSLGAHLLANSKWSKGFQVVQVVTIGFDHSVPLSVMQLSLQPFHREEYSEREFRSRVFYGVFYGACIALNTSCRFHDLSVHESSQGE